MHLEQWQRRVFPSNVMGGVKGKKTSDVFHHLAIMTEKAIIEKSDAVGIKLDRTKCFDRICPSLIKHFGIALGIDPRFFTVWCQLYDGFKRYLSLGAFIDECALANANGVAQGDSASVLAVNILMTGWSLMMKRFCNVRAFIFIDDCYLFAHLQHADQLKHAIAATKLFDGLTGQELNIAKSASWASTKNARLWLQQHFPTLPISEMINILGSMVKTSRGNKTLDGSTLAYVVKTTIADIGGLPIDLEKKGFLLATKAVAKLLYAPELMPWPKMTLDAMVTNIARALWGSRPHWRSTELLFATCTNAATTHPYLAIAARIFSNLANRVRTDEKFAMLWVELCQLGKVISRGLLDVFTKACATLGFEFTPPFQISFMSIRFCMHSVYPKHIRRICKVAAAQSLYSSAIRSARKDLVMGPTGVMDVDLAPPGTRFEPWRRMSGYDPAIVPGFLTGAAPTSDRLFHANLCGSQQCRWCGAEKETIHHLAGNCEKVNQLLGCPLLPFSDQPNLATHGIFEVPQALLSQNICQWNGDDLPPCQHSEDQVTVWGDGSIANADHFYSRTMGFAVVDASGAVLYKCGVHDPMACSFKAELLALVAAVRLRGPNIHYVTDCKSLRDTFRMILQLGYVPLNLSFAHWWNEIFASTGHRDRCQLVITWIRAHQFDRSRAGIDVLHLHNLFADAAAREAAVGACPVSHRSVKAWRQILVNHQAWLCRLMKLISAQKDVDNATVEPVDGNGLNAASDGEPLEQQLRNKYSSWEWDTPIAHFDWQCGMVQPVPPTSWKFSQQAWDETCRFFLSLRWRTSPDDRTSVYQLAYQFWKFTPCIPPAIDSKHTGLFLLFVDWIRYFLRISSAAGFNFLPGAVRYDGRRIMYSNGYFPKGTFFGATALMSASDRTCFAKFLFLNPSVSRGAKGWAIAMASIP
eukprot:Skav204964  [mRNA]  locus=scaffold3912:163221:165989:+ [translate_table: standard]